MKKSLSFLIMAILAIASLSVSLTSCSSKKEPIKLTCEFCNGTGQDIQCNGSGECPSCDGTGKCDVCKGTGVCQHCHGTGLVRAKCPKCHGYGFLKANPGEEPPICKYCKSTGLDPRGKKAPCPYCVEQTKQFKKRVAEGKINKTEYEKMLKADNFLYIEKALKGIKKGTGKCPSCLGTGKCNTCNGTGKCTNCHGTGKCPECKGHGFNIKVVVCPNCYDTIPYNSTECPHCHTKLKYDGADTCVAKELPKTTN